MIPTCVASADERQRAMPADVLIPDPVASVTHAITIRTGPRRVWPWMAQMGAGRAGWYAYDRIDNGGRPSADVILPEYQDIQPGDILPALPGATDAFVVAGLERYQHLVLTAPGPRGGVRMTWEMRIEATAGGRSRLVVRTRLSRRWLEEVGTSAAPESPLPVERAIRLLPRLPRRIGMPVAVAGHGARERRMLRGIKKRAEQGLERIPVISTGRRRLVDRLLPRAAVAERRGAGASRSGSSVGAA